MQHTSLMGTGRKARVRRCSAAAVFGLITALGVLAAPAETPSSSRICVGAMQTTACVPPA